MRVTDLVAKEEAGLARDGRVLARGKLHQAGLMAQAMAQIHLAGGT
jgi:hypothetical protein